MRDVESWQTKRQVATSIQRMPVLIAVPPVAEAVPEKACWARTIGSLGESTAADTVRVIQCSKERFQNRQADALAEREGFFQPDRIA
jgi:hypothetical protein